MPKKKVEKIMETRTMSKRAASKEALRQMQSIISEQAAYDSPEATLEITSEEEEEDEVVTVDLAPKRKYRLSHRKSSDGNDRDVLVLKNIGWKEETLKLEAWEEDLSPVQLELRLKSKNEIDDINNKLDKLLKDTSSEVIFQGDNTALFEFEKEVREKPRSTQSNNATLQSSKNNNQSGFQLVMDPRSGVVVGTMTPAPVPAVVTPVPKPQTRKRTRASTNLSPIPTPPTKIPKQTIPPTPAPAPPTIQPRPTEATAVGGLSHGSNQKGGSIVDLTSDDGRTLADSREISFNKLQGKTFPSLVVVARPHLRIKDSGGVERGKLDSKVKSVLMHPPTKFTEWLIQQGLIRSEQSCTAHAQSKLKLGMYSDVSKFPFSGGYVWISECCPQRFVSVFSGSLFEGSPHPPSVILKLMYHWACQTNVQNVVQWVKVDNLYVKGLNTWLRATCTVALHTHIRPLGGPGKKVEVGVISLGTTSQDGHQRQVKVEVLGLLETEAKLIRLRAVEPLVDGDRNYKKRFSKILEPLLHWVHPDSTIVTDLTVDKVTLHSMGFKYVMQTTSTDGVNNHTIMEYLRRIVPRMFQNTLSLLSRQIIQQFLDELVWREWFGTTAVQGFDNIVLHLSEQTRVDAGQSLIVRLNKVACNPFKNWSIKHYLNFQSSKALPAATTVPSTPVATTNTTTESASQKRLTKRKVTFKPPSPTSDISRPTKSVSPDIPEQMVPVEHYYYGSIEGVKKQDESSALNLKCNMCKAQFTNNIKLMTHLFTHAHNVVHSGVHQCCYCLATMTSKEILDKHIAISHPADTRSGESLVCIICEDKFSNTYSLGKHMSKEHVPSELPYQCGTCQFRCSSHKQAVDHFYVSHNGAGAIQCPFCLKSTLVYSNGRNVPQNLSYFLQHLYKHQKKSYPKKCPKCALWFVQKDIIKDHLSKMHATQRRKAGLVPWPVPRVTIMVPKSRQEEPVEEEEVDISNVLLDVQESLKCKECSISLKSPNHYPALLYCSDTNCQYSTCCRHAMNKHSTDCKIFNSTLPVQRLPFRMYCVCGYNDFDGNLMAKHLTVCERKSAYPSEEAAKAATVTHSMLDVLGLVRRLEEPVIASNDIMEIDSDDDKVPNSQTSQLEKENNTDKNENINNAVDLLSDKQSNEKTEKELDKLNDNDKDNDIEMLEKDDNSTDINKIDKENITVIEDNAKASVEQSSTKDENQLDKTKDKQEENDESTKNETTGQKVSRKIDINNQQSKSNNVGIETENLISNKQSKHPAKDTSTKNMTENNKIYNDDSDNNSMQKNSRETIEADCHETVKQVLCDDSKTDEVNDIEHIIQ